MRAGGASLSTGGGGGGSFSSGQSKNRFAGRWSKYSKRRKGTADHRTNKYTASLKKGAPKNDTDVAEIFRKRKDYRSAKYRRGIDDPGQGNIGGKDILSPINPPPPKPDDGSGGGGGGGGGGEDGKNDSRGAIRKSYWAKVLYPNLKERKRSS